MLASGCSRGEAPIEPPTTTETRPLGSLTIDGAATAITGCATGSTADGSFVDLVYAGGALRFSRGHLAAGTDDLTCAKLDRKWQAGQRADRTVYWRGFLDVRCTGPHRVEGKIELTCGHPSPAELEILDRDQASHSPEAVP